MVIVLFEVEMKLGKMDKYLEIAKSLGQDLIDNGGILTTERFFSIQNENKLLSYSTWKSEKDVDNWRNQLNHRLSQLKGKEAIFENYTLTVAKKIRRYTEIDREEVPEDSKVYFKEI